MISEEAWNRLEIISLCVLLGGEVIGSIEIAYIVCRYIGWI